MPKSRRASVWPPANNPPLRELNLQVARCTSVRGLSNIVAFRFA